MAFTTVMFLISINIIVFSFIAWNVKNKSDLKREEIRAGSGSQSLGTSELKGLIQEAMAEAISPLEDRLDKMESSLRQLPAARSELTVPDNENGDDR